MSNVVSFNDLSDQAISAYYIGLPRVILEGTSDVRLFEQYWFRDMMDTFEFVEAGRVADGGGCTAVALAVMKSRAQNIPAFGIVDRDHLFRSQAWTDLFELDDAAFADRTSNNDVYTTTRWEIEAYLLEPEMISAWVRSFSKPPGSPARISAAVAEAIKEAEQLVRANGFFATSHTVGKSCPAQYFSGISVDALAGAASEALAGLDADGSVAQEVDMLVEAILARAPTEQEDRLRWLLRYVDTKRLLHRLRLRYTSSSEVIWYFAELMMRSNERPRELEHRLNVLRDHLS